MTHEADGLIKAYRKLDEWKIENNKPQCQQNQTNFTKEKQIRSNLCFNSEYL
jgi:hypothetical protein